MKSKKKILVKKIATCFEEENFKGRKINGLVESVDDDDDNDNDKALLRMIVEENVNCDNDNLFGVIDFMSVEFYHD